MLTTAVSERSIDVRPENRNTLLPMAVSVVGIKTDDSAPHA